MAGTVNRVLFCFQIRYKIQSISTKDEKEATSALRSLFTVSRTVNKLVKLILYRKLSLVAR